MRSGLVTTDSIPVLAAGHDVTTRLTCDEVLTLTDSIPAGS